MTDDVLNILRPRPVDGVSRFEGLCLSQSGERYFTMTANACAIHVHRRWPSHITNTWM